MVLVATRESMDGLNDVIIFMPEINTAIETASPSQTQNHQVVDPSEKAENAIEASEKLK